MNGTQFYKSKFTLPASEKTSQVRWDLAFMTDAEFEKKYGQDKQAWKK